MTPEYESGTTEDVMRTGRLPSGLQEHRGQDGRTHYAIYFMHGRQKYYLNLGGVDREYAERKLTEVKEFAHNRALGLGVPEPAQTMMTFRELAKLYLDTYKTDMLAQGAAMNGWEAVNKSFKRCEASQTFYDKPAALATATDMLNLRNALLKSYAGKSGRTVRNTLIDLRTIFNYGMKAALRIVLRNPIDGDLIASVPISQPQYFELNPHEDAKLLVAAREHWLICAILLGMDLGLRQNSILNLLAENVVLEERLLLVTTLKGKRRKIKLPEWKPIGTRRLMTSLAAQIETARALDSRWLLPSPRWPDQHISENHLLRAFQAATKKAEFGRQKFHHLRHIFNTRAALCLSEEVRRAVSSHESVEASRHYTHLNTRRGALSILREVSKLDDLLAREGWNESQFQRVPDEKGLSEPQLQ